MMFLKESLYGWGVCDIPMPRTSHDIFSDRRRKNIRALGQDRRGHNEQQGVLATILGILNHDIPWFQTSLTILVSMLSIILVFFMSKLIPEFSEREIPEPVEVMINLLEEFDKIPPVHRAPQKREVTIIEEKPAPVEKPIPKEKQESTFEETLPEIKIRSGIERKPSSAAITPAPQESSFEKPTQPEEIDISVSTEQMQRYSSESTDQTERELVPQQSRLVLEHSDVTPELDPLRQQQKNYNLKTTTQAKVAPSFKADFFAVQSDISAETVSTANLPKKDYKINTPDRTVAMPVGKTDPLFTQPRDSIANISRKTPTKKNYDTETSNRVVAVPTGRTDSFLTQQESQVSAITPAARTQKTYKRNIDPGNRVSAAPSTRADSFLAKSDSSAEVVSPVSPSQRSYPLNVAGQDKSLVLKSMSDSKAFATASPAEPTEASLSKPDQLSRQYTLDPNGTTHRSSALPGPADQSQFLISQKDGMIQEEDLKVGIKARPASKPAQGNSAAVSVPAGSHDFLDMVSIDEIDPSQLISLKELAVCADPEEEFHLKTKLATVLGGPARCNSDGILFFFKYTESGYTIQVNIYNPKGEFLKDRCSVLSLAIDCVENLRAKGVSP